MAESGRPLVAVVELGGYPDFSELYRRLGYTPETVNAGRRALGAIRQRQPAVIVAEFNFQRDFRDRTSALESILALAQQIPGCRVIAFYEPHDAEPLQRLRARFPQVEPLPRPVDPAALEGLLATQGEHGGRR